MSSFRSDPDYFTSQILYTLIGKHPSMNAYHRYRVINNLLKNSGTTTKKEIIAACKRAFGDEGTSKRTIEGDIELMRKDPPEGFKAPIFWDSKIRKYRYTDDDYSIDGIPLRDDDLKNLVFAAAVLNQYKDISYFNQFHGSVQKIVDATNLRRRQSKESEYEFIEFENNPIIKGSNYLETIVDHILEQEVIELTYHPFTREKPGVYIVHPYYLKEYGGRWYMLAQDEKGRIIKSFSLDRIEKIKVLSNRNYRPSSRDFKAHFQNVIGIMIPEKEPEEVIVAYTKFQSKYALTQPLHASQKLLSKTDELDRVYFSYHLIPNFELTQKLLGWSDQVEVISPVWYREEVKKTVGEMGRVYETNQ